MRSDTEDSSKQQPAQQRHYDEAWDDWDAAQVSTSSNSTLWLLCLFIFFLSAAGILFFFIFYVYRFRGKEYNLILFENFWRQFVFRACRCIRFHSYPRISACIFCLFPDKKVVLSYLKVVVVVDVFHCQHLPW